jgi:DNA-binding NarL/FixJ family response regulator
MTSVALVVSPSSQIRSLVETCIRGLVSNVEVYLVASTDSVAELRLSASPKLMVLDLDGSQASAADIRALVRGYPEAVLVVISESIDPAGIERALRAGARAYIPKSYSAHQIRLVLELAMSGASHRPDLPAASALPAGQPASPAPTIASLGNGGGPLTPKQVEVLSYVAAGMSNRQIAGRLKIAEGTVKLHVNSIFKKLNVERRGEAIVLARRMEEIQRQQVEQGQRGEMVLDWLLPHVGHRRLRQGDILFRKGDPGKELFYLQRGRVSLDDIGVEMGPGQIFGEIGVFAPERTRTSTARCLTDVELFCLNSEQVKSIYYLNPQFALHIVTLLAQRLVEERMD